MRLQNAISSLVESPGEVKDDAASPSAAFNKYRALKTATRQGTEPFRFVDGELLERLLRCPLEIQEEVVNRLAIDGVNVDAIKELVEELRRMH